MGWAKYEEDNFEIMRDRCYMRDAYRRETEASGQPDASTQPYSDCENTEKKCA